MPGDLAELEQALAPWAGRLEARLHDLEPFRALSGLPDSGEQRSQLESELAGLHEFRVHKLVADLLAELRQQPTAELGPLTEAEIRATSQVEAISTAPTWQGEDLAAEASAAVASMFGGTHGVPVVTPVSPPALPEQNAPVAVGAPEPAASANVAAFAFFDAAPPEPPPQRHPLNEPQLEKAEAKVLESLEKLRTAPVVEANSMASTMANVAAAVAATVATAGRIAEPVAVRTLSIEALPPPLPPVPTRAAPERTASIQHAPAFRSRPMPPPAAITVEATEIRFVERPASPMLDVPPRVKPVPRPDLPVTPPRTVAAPAIASKGASPPPPRMVSDFEEASVEIRRAPGANADAAAGVSSKPDGAAGTKPGAALGRFVRSLTGNR